MSDVFARHKRSEVMARIRSRGNRDTELALARLLRREGISGWRRQRALRFRVQDSGFRVRPDFIFSKERLAVFVDGCFWHGCPRHSNPAKWIRKSSMGARRVQGSGFRVRRSKFKSSRTGKRFWWRKMLANQRRDELVNRTLRRAGWRVLRIWEHELARKNQPRLARRLSAAIGT